MPAVNALDAGRILLALLVAAIHTGPLADVSPLADFLLCRGVARLAVPVFFLCTGYFSLSKGGWRRSAVRHLALYAAGCLFYLPLSVYAGHCPTVPAFLRRVATGAGFYHLWYLLSAAVGCALVAALVRLFGFRRAGVCCLALYLFGLCGDSFYGLAAALPGLGAVLDAYFSVFPYTRNGLFFAPLFLWLGWALADSKVSLPRRALPFSLAALLLEALALRATGWPRHDSMYLFLPVTAALLFETLRALGGPPRPRLRRMAFWVYFLHPFWLVAVRGAAKVTGLAPLHSLLQYAMVCAVSLLAALLLTARRPAPSATGRAWIEVDRAALRHNVAVLRAALPPFCRLMPAVKAEAYGNGLVPAARELQSAGIQDFCVACAAEGVALRRAGIRGQILILGYTAPADFEVLRRWRLTQTVVDEAYAARLAAHGGLTVHLGIDTGMHRLGLPCRPDTVAPLLTDRRLRVTGLFTHLCTDDEPDPTFAETQIARFTALQAGLLDAGLSCPPAHLQSSYGIFRHSGLPYAWARPGLALYGMLGTAADSSHYAPALRPVLSLKARVATVRTLAPGEGAGYGLCYTARAPATLATVVIGYADGVPRALSCGVGRALLHGQSAPIAGRVCMDQLLLDVTGIDGVAPGDIVTLLGDALPAAEWAEKTGTIPNEILSRLGARLPRLYI